MAKTRIIDIVKIIPEAQKNISLKNHTAFKIGGRAKYFFVAKNKEDLTRAVTAAKKSKIPFFILGNGSNLLVSDKGYKGLVIKMLNSELKIINSRIYSGAGTMLNRLVDKTKNAGLQGLEWASGIPGTLGGALRGNAGAFGSSIADSVQEIEVYDVRNNKIKIFKNKDCRFSYRNSIFKENKNLIIVSAVFKLKKGDKKEIINKIKKCLSYRKKRHPLNFPSAGSIFINPKDLSARELIEKCGFKGKKIGQAQISEKHANFIINLGGARASNVKRLINFVKKKAKQKFSIVLKEEIEYLG